MTPRPMWATVEWGGKRIETASNIVFSNGLFDPWWASSCLHSFSGHCIPLCVRGFSKTLCSCSTHREACKPSGSQACHVFLLP